MVAAAAVRVVRPSEAAMLVAVLLAGLMTAAGVSVPREAYVVPAAGVQHPQVASPPRYPQDLPLAAVDPLTALLLLASGAQGASPAHVTSGGCSPALLQHLLLARYGRYLPYGLGSYGFYGGGASNLHAAKVLGQYKYEDRL